MTVAAQMGFCYNVLGNVGYLFDFANEAEQKLPFSNLYVNTRRPIFALFEVMVFESKPIQ